MIGLAWQRKQNERHHKREKDKHTQLIRRIRVDDKTIIYCNGEKYEINKEEIYEPFPPKDEDKNETVPIRKE